MICIKYQILRMSCQSYFNVFLLKSISISSKSYKKITQENFLKTSVFNELYEEKKKTMACFFTHECILKTSAHTYNIITYNVYTID